MIVHQYIDMNLNATLTFVQSRIVSQDKSQQEFQPKLKV